MANMLFIVLVLLFTIAIHQRVHLRCGVRIGLLCNPRHCVDIGVIAAGDSGRQHIADSRRQWGGSIGICRGGKRSEEHTSELQSLMRISYAVFCLHKKNSTLVYIRTSPSHTLYTPATSSLS